MNRGSTNGGKQMLELLCSQDDLVVIDQRLPGRSRGTWCLNRTGEWYELDLFFASSKYAGRFGGMKTWSIGESDHAARGVRYRIATVPKSGRDGWRDRGGDSTVKKRFGTAKLNQAQAQRR